MNQSGPDVFFSIFNQILQAFQTDPKMLQMMTNMDFYVTPVLNIDGYIYTWENTTVGCSVPWMFIKLLLEGSWSQSHRWKRDEMI